MFPVYSRKTNVNDTFNDGFSWKSLGNLLKLFSGDNWTDAELNI